MTVQTCESCEEPFVPDPRIDEDRRPDRCRSCRDSNDESDEDNVPEFLT